MDSITEVSDYDAFAREWHAIELSEHDVTHEEARERGLITEDDTRMLWQLLGLLDDDEVLIQLPEWIAEEKVGYVDGAAPTEFIGRIDRETEKAIRFVDSAAARELMKTAHRIHQLEQGVEDADEDRREWLENRLEEKRREFEEREDVIELQEEWIPKSQLSHVVRRTE